MSIKVISRLMLVFLVIIIVGCGTQQSQLTTNQNQSEEIHNSESVSNNTSNIDTESSDNSNVSQPIIEKEQEPTTATNVAPNLKGELKVHFIDVGQGASQLLIGPTGKTMLIDAGNNNKENLIVQYLKKEKIERIDILIGTHPDADHIGGLDAVINNFDIGKIYMPKIQANTQTFEDVLLAIKNKGLKVTTAKSGIELDWEDNIQIKMIAPVNQYSDVNEMSAVLHVMFGTSSFLLTGDAESNSETDILASGADLAADVFLVGHHGSNSSTSQEFLGKVNPQYAVIQVGKNSYGHPTPELLKKLKDKEIIVFRNDELGNIVFISDGENINVNIDDWKYVENIEKKNVEPAKVEKEVEKPVVKTENDVVYYKNCTEVRAAGKSPIREGDPGFERKFDRDGDGVGCE